MHTHLDVLLQMSYPPNIEPCINISEKLLEFYVAASHCITRGANRGTNKAVKASNEPIIYTLWDISQPPLLSPQTGALQCVCLPLLMRMMMMRTMMVMKPAPPIPSTRACSSAPAGPQSKFISTLRYCSLCEHLTVHKLWWREMLDNDFKNRCCHVQGVWHIGVSFVCVFMPKTGARYLWWDQNQNQNLATNSEV